MDTHGRQDLQEEEEAEEEVQGGGEVSYGATREKKAWKAKGDG